MHPGIGNAKQFSCITLKCLQGSIPKQIKGSYFRNGPGMFTLGKETLEHWFNGDGFLLKLNFKNGQCQALTKFVDTPLYRRRMVEKTFNKGLFKKMWIRWNEGKQYANPANTSVLCLKNSPNFLALCEGGAPFILKKENLKPQGFSDFGWMTSAFSAHPKVDPQNGDIFNIGMKNKGINIMRATKDMKKICETSFTLRQIQSIHDFCLAGDYLVIFEGPIRFHPKDWLWNNKFFFNCLSLDQSLPMLAHIYTKSDLKLVKTLNLKPFYNFHFTNGFSTKQKIVVQYVKYNMESSKQLFKAIEQIPKFCQGQFDRKYPGTSELEQLTISLQNFQMKTRSIKINGEFPVCEDHECGKQWRYTYAVGSQQNQLFKFDTLYRYDRNNQKLDKNFLEGKVHINQPAIIRTSNNLYLLCIINRDRKSFIEIFEAQTLKSLCQLELPEFVPAGFHGKWQSECY